MKDLSSLDLEELYKIEHKVKMAIWRKRHPYLLQLKVDPYWGARGEDARKIVAFLEERGFHVSKDVVFRYLQKYDKGEITTLDVLEHVLKVADMASTTSLVTIERDYYSFRPTYGDARDRVETTIHPIDKNLASLFFEYMLERNSTELPVGLIEKLPEAPYTFKETARGPSWVEGKKIYNIRLPAVEIIFREQVTGIEWKIQVYCYFVTSVDC